ncbi:MAG: glycosyltransferase [Anaerolineae bacterium]|nr:glycosyltransferase [Anaerolineae bacterium]
MNILFLSGWFPYPANNGTRLRVSALLNGIARYHDVSLISFGDEHDRDHIGELRQVCRDVHVVPYRAYNPTSAHALLSLANPTPRSIVDTYVPEMAQTIRQALSQHRYHLVIASQQRTAAYAAAFRGVPAIFEELEVGVFATRRQQATSALGRLRGTLTIVKLRQYLQRLLPAFGACTVVSQPERDLLTQFAPNYSAVEIIPNCVELARYQLDPLPTQPASLIYTGSFTYQPNYEAMRWFVGDVLPLVKAQEPAVHLTITGEHANRPLPPADNVTLTGMVDNLGPLVARSAIALAPLREGGGTRLKILEAMALRTPVIATSKGVEGLEAEHERHLLIADTAEDFAQAVVRLLREPGLRDRLAGEAYQLIERKYNWDAVLPGFLTLAETVARA